MLQLTSMICLEGSKTNTMLSRETSRVRHLSIKNSKPVTFYSEAWP